MKTTDDFFDVIDDYMGHIQWFYKKFEDKNPVMELSLPSGKIYAYPYSEYLKTLSERSQGMLKKEYNEAIKNKEMVVFVRDNEEKVLKSRSFPIEEIDYPEQEISTIQ
jgi:hypothetical protein